MCLPDTSHIQYCYLFAEKYKMQSTNREHDARQAAESLLTGSSSSQQRTYVINQQQQRHNQYLPIHHGYYGQHSIIEPSKSYMMDKDKKRVF
jgi:hypothetical protein